MYIAETAKASDSRRLAGDVPLAVVTRGIDTMQTLQPQIQNQPAIAVQTLERSVVELQDAISQHLPFLHKRAYRYLGNSHDAEDAVQDALLSAYKHLDQFKGNARMTTWLISIVTNSALSYLRKRPRQPHTSLDERLPHDQSSCVADRLVDARPGPEDEYAMSEVREHLMQFVGELSPTFRQAIQLRDFDGLTTSEAALVLGVPEGTLKARLSRARSQLKRQARFGLQRTTGIARAQQFSHLQAATN
jgi:RNA polymerase sigma-70 factor, ECF subfamily